MRQPEGTETLLPRKVLGKGLVVCPERRVMVT